ncbi:hypothetical protein BD413DRAFT_599725 [Trametes elegans]|nr:hypothetical protein BD413DRAFT_599725 [Trametes elegans]
MVLFYFIRMTSYQVQEADQDRLPGVGRQLTPPIRLAVTSSRHCRWSSPLLPLCTMPQYLLPLARAEVWEMADQTVPDGRRSWQLDTARSRTVPPR